MAGRPPKFPDEAVELARTLSGGTTKMSAHNQIYRQRAIMILRGEIEQHSALATRLSPLLDRPSKTILAELGRLDNPRALIWQALAVARGQAAPRAKGGKRQPATAVVAWLQRHRLAGTLHGKPPKSVTEWPSTGRRRGEDSS